MNDVITTIDGWLAPVGGAAMLALVIIGLAAFIWLVLMPLAIWRACHWAKVAAREAGDLAGRVRRGADAMRVKAEDAVARSLHQRMEDLKTSPSRSRTPNGNGSA